MSGYQMFCVTSAALAFIAWLIPSSSSAPFLDVVLLMCAAGLVFLAYLDGLPAETREREDVE